MSSSTRALRPRSLSRQPTLVSRCSIAALLLLSAAALGACAADDKKGGKEGGLAGADGSAGIGKSGSSGGAGTDGAAGSDQDASAAGTSGGASGSSSAGTSGDSGGTGASGGLAGTDGMTCAEGDANATPVTPTVWLVVDGSSSMNTAFDGAMSRWTSLRSTLMDKGGVVPSLAASVRFGLVMYAGSGGADCPNLVTIDPKVDNFAALDAAYPMSPLGSGTPTDRALDYVVSNLPVNNKMVLDADAAPVFVILATDGAPNATCGASGMQNGSGLDPVVAKAVIDITKKGTKAGMQMLVISMAGSDQVLQMHLDDVANATKSQDPPYVPATKDDLVAAFKKIVGGATCTISLKGTVDAAGACRGTVTLNGKKLSCNSSNGWKLSDSHTIKLMGVSCDEFTSKVSQVVAKFPCDVIVPD